MLIKENFFNVFINVLEHKQPCIHYGGHMVTIHKDHYSQYWKVHNCLPERLLFRSNHIRKRTILFFIKTSRRMFKFQRKRISNKNILKITQ